MRTHIPDTKQPLPAEASGTAQPVSAQLAAETPSVPERFSAAHLEHLIGWLLLAGVLTSAAVVLLGGVTYVWRHSHATVHYRVFRGEPSDLRSLSGIWQDVKAFTGRGVIQLGLILLVASQVLRVVSVGGLFLKRRDCLYVVVTLMVLALLIFGLFFEPSGRT